MFVTIPLVWSQYLDLVKASLIGRVFRPLPLGEEMRAYSDLKLVNMTCLNEISSFISKYIVFIESYKSLI